MPSLPSRKRAWGLLLLGWCLPMASGAQNAPKPEIKFVSRLAVRAGQTETVVLYGENLAPQSVLAGKPLLTVKLLRVQPTEERLKARGNVAVELEVTATPNCPPDTVELSLIHPNNQTAKALLAVVEDGPAEVEVKRPNATFAQAMPLAGPTVTVTGNVQNGDTPERFRWEGNAGEVWEISVLAGRVGSELDALLRVRDSRRISLALSGGDAKRDRKIRFRVPKTGVYFLELSDADSRGGPNFRYRLTLRRLKTPPENARKNRDATQRCSGIPSVPADFRVQNGASTLGSYRPFA